MFKLRRRKGSSIGSIVQRTITWSRGSFVAATTAWVLPWMRLWLFWISFFAAFRVAFIATQPHAWPAGQAWSPWLSLWHGLPLDLSTTGYLVLVPMLLYHAGLFLKSRHFKYVQRMIYFYNITLLLLLTGLFGANIFLYPEWGTLVNVRAVRYLMTSPESLSDSVSPLFMAGAAVLYGGLMAVAVIFYKKTTFWQRPPALYAGVLIFPLHLALVLLAVRGGTGVMAINESAVYYSEHPFNNHAATNTFWHLIHTILESKGSSTSYVFFEEQEAQRLLAPLFAADSTNRSDLLRLSIRPATAFQPNVVIIALESMTAQVIEHLGGTPGLCPHIEALTKEGLRFDSCYSSGFRTDQGLPAILSGYPAQPDQSILLLTEKSETMAGLPKLLRLQGYNTAFYYGGELTFANVGLWLRSQGIERIVSEKDFDEADVTQRWGVDDERLLQRCCRDMAQLHEPFFVTALTLSLHPPYDIPGQTAPLTDEAALFRRSAQFTDQAVGHFMAAARQQEWYDRTLFVFTADHGSLQPGRLAGDNPAAKHVPWLICGVPLDSLLKGRSVSPLCNHHDIPATLLALLGLDSAAARALFPWSRNVLSLSSGVSPRSVPFAYYTNENGLGWMEGSSAGFYEFNARKWLFFGDSLSPEAQARSKAYLQLLYDDFLKK